MHLMTLGGVPIRLHPTFVWMVGGLLVFTGVREGVEAASLLLVLVVGFFLSVLWHELGHAFAARLYGIRTRSIVLLPIGGVAQLEMRQAPAWVDMVISAAGPGASLLLGLVGLAVGTLLGAKLLLTLGIVNVALGLFNLIPAFPMDGGRVLRALLVGGLGRRTGMRIALGVGAVLGLGFLMVGLWVPEPGLVLMAGFLWFVQVREWRSQELSGLVGVGG